MVNLDAATYKTGGTCNSHFVQDKVTAHDRESGQMLSHAFLISSQWFRLFFAPALWAALISGSEVVYNCAQLVPLRRFVPKLFSILVVFKVQLLLLLFSLILFFLFLCVSRIWWMISAKSSSWSWAIWTEARNTVHEAGAECQSEAVESLLVGHTGVQIHGKVLSNCWVTERALTCT